MLVNNAFDCFSTGASSFTSHCCLKYFRGKVRLKKPVVLTVLNNKMLLLSAIMYQVIIYVWLSL